MRNLLVILAIGAFFAQGCFPNDDDQPVNVCEPVPAEDQEDIINEFIDANGLTMETSTTGLRYSIETPGMGDNILLGDTIEIEYRGALLSGLEFDSGTFGPIVFEQGAFIAGFEESLLKLNEGSQGIFILPGEIAYGCFPPPGSFIGDNEILVFEIDVITVNF